MKIKSKNRERKEVVKVVEQTTQITKKNNNSDPRAIEIKNVEKTQKKCNVDRDEEI